MLSLNLSKSIERVPNHNNGDKKSTNSGVKIVSEQNSRIYKLHFNKKPSDAVKVRICNRADQTIFKETINEKGAFTRPYNLSLLPKDSYFIEVIDGNYLFTDSGGRIHLISR